MFIDINAFLAFVFSVNFSIGRTKGVIRSLIYPKTLALECAVKAEYY